MFVVLLWFVVFGGGCLCCFRDYFVLRLIDCVDLYLLIVLVCSFITCVVCWCLLMLLLSVGLLVLICRFLGYVSLLCLLVFSLTFVLIAARRLLGLGCVCCFVVVCFGCLLSD